MPPEDRDVQTVGFLMATADAITCMLVSSKIRRLRFRKQDLKGGQVGAGDTGITGGSCCVSSNRLSPLLQAPARCWKSIFSWTTRTELACCALLRKLGSREHKARIPLSLATGVVDVPCSLTWFGGPGQQPARPWSRETRNENEQLGAAWAPMIRYTDVTRSKNCESGGVFSLLQTSTNLSANLCLGTLGSLGRWAARLVLHCRICKPAEQKVVRNKQTSRCNWRTSLEEICRQGSNTAKCSPKTTAFLHMSSSPRQAGTGTTMDMLRNTIVTSCQERN